MPTKQLNYWIHTLESEIMYANLFGPTETTDICTFYVVNREFEDDESLPIGKPCNNCDAFIINEKGEPAVNGKEGELFVRSTFMAGGIKDTEIIREAVRKKVPPYMMPDQVVRVRQMPQNANGKIDRVKLKELI